MAVITGPLGGVAGRAPVAAQPPVVEGRSARRRRTREKWIPVGHVGDRDLVLLHAREDGAPHAAGDDAVQAAHRVGAPGQAQRQDRHAEGLELVLGVAAPEAQELLLGQTEEGRVVAQVLQDELRREVVVAGLDGRVRGEHEVVGGRGPGGLEGDAVAP